MPGHHPLLKLLVESDKQGQADPTVPVHWTISQELIDELKAQNFVDPHLLVTVGHNEHIDRGTYTYDCWKDTCRYLVPLKDLMLYVSFSSAGENWIYAAIVDMQDAYDDFGEKIMWRTTTGYKRDVLTKYKFDRYICGAKTLWGKGSSLTFRRRVIVPKEMFAKEPPAWIANIVSKIWKHGHAFDECDLRMRVIVAGAFMCIYCPAKMLVNLLSAVYCLVFMIRRPAFRQLLHPIDSDWWGVEANSAQCTFWLSEKRQGNDNRYQERDNLLLLFNPYLLLYPALVVYGIFQIPLDHGHRAIHLGLLNTLMWVDGIILGVVIAVVIVIALGKLWHVVDDKRIRVKTPISVIRYQELTTLTSLPTVTGKFDIEDLPEDLQTVRLRFWRLKKRVCRPYAIK